MRWTTTPPAPTRLPGNPEVVAEDVVAQLEAAGRTLLRLPHSEWSMGARSWWPSVVQDPSEAYGWTGETVRMARPAAAEISAMDAAFGLLARVPHDRHVLRRIVAARALVHPVTDRHIYSWRRLGVLIGADYKAVQRWHAEGIRAIVASLNRVGPAA